jgi:hypothetical protein
MRLHTSMGGSPSEDAMVRDYILQFGHVDSGGEACINIVEISFCCKYGGLPIHRALERLIR